MRTFKIFLVFSLIFSLFFGVAKADWFVSEITEIAFPREVINSDSPVVVVFYSGSFMGKYARMIDDYAKKKSPVKILKMDRTLNRVTVKKYNIRRNFTFTFFADGELIEKTTSIGNADDLAEFIDFCLVKYSKMREEEKKSEWRPDRIKKLEEEKEKNKENQDSDKKQKKEREDYMYR